ncbi:hypothetical protein FB45DRAFT_868087 [Roridomyces roridus]|uniref:Uncharacterized protein n=1 Tax=Roridomyces roridus TaxID=1738132 RepID=A0AAD7FLH6_9AGAR|nr:hypothetical protein FB45DRAFT_868087 [Roridomyces roridus]
MNFTGIWTRFTVFTTHAESWAFHGDPFTYICLHPMGPSTTFHHTAGQLITVWGDKHAREEPRHTTDSESNLSKKKLEGDMGHTHRITEVWPGSLGSKGVALHCLLGLKIDVLQAVAEGMRVEVKVGEQPSPSYVSGGGAEVESIESYSTAQQGPGPAVQVIEDDEETLARRSGSKLEVVEGRRRHVCDSSWWERAREKAVGRGEPEIHIMTSTPRWTVWTRADSCRERCHPRRHRDSRCVNQGYLDQYDLLHTEPAGVKEKRDTGRLDMPSRGIEPRKPFIVEMQNYISNGDRRVNKGYSLLALVPE